MAGEREAQGIPDWAQEERKHDLAWIAENKTSFWPAAQSQFQAQGRGVIVVDTTQKPEPDAGHPMYYLPRVIVEHTNDTDTLRMVKEYNPESEFVVLLLKPEGKSSTYRVQTVENMPFKTQRGRPRSQ